LNSGVDCRDTAMKGVFGATMLGIGSMRRHRRVRQHRHCLRCRWSRGASRHRACGRSRHLKRAEQRPARGEYAGERRHLRIWLCLSHAVARLHRRLDVPLRQDRFHGHSRARLRRLSDEMVGNESLVTPVAVGTVIALTAIVVMGIRRSNRAKIAIVSITLFALVFFVLAGFPQLRKGGEPWHPFFLPSEGGRARTSRSHRADVRRLHRLRAYRHAWRGGAHAGAHHPTRHHRQPHRLSLALYLCRRGRHRRNWSAGFGRRGAPLVTAVRTSIRRSLSWSSVSAPSRRCSASRSISF
jgi:hypothetical protein